MPFPDFLVIGAQKAGTTSLFTYLRQHPGLHLSPRKEPHFFCGPGEDRPPAWTGPVDRVVLGRSVFDRDDYRALFADAGDRRTGEMSTGYLVDPTVPARVVDANPEVRVVALLRDPVARAYSAWWMWRQGRWDGLDFAAALAAEAIRTAGEHERLGADPSAVSHAHRHHTYVAQGCYADALARWFAAYGRDAVHVIVCDELFSDPTATMGRLYRDLGLPDHALGDPRVHNDAAGAAMDPATRAWLVERYRDEVRHLEELLGRDLPW